MALQLTRTLPDLNAARLPCLEKALGVRLPDDYKRFLLQFNGGLTPPHADYTFEAPIQQVREDLDEDLELDRVAFGLCEFFGYDDLPRETTEGEPRSLVTMNAMFRDEDFLPRGVIAIAEDHSNSLVCLATNAHDFGAVYCWYYYWQYPWAAAHFDAKLEAVRNAWEDYEDLIDNQENPRFLQLADQLNYASLTRVADSFEAFLDLLIEVPCAGDDEVESAEGL